MERERAKEIFNELYKDVNGRALSLKWREDKQETSKSFVYGEVLPDSFYEMISAVSPRPGQVFYDLGSGTGKAVFLAYLMFDFRKSCGIELVDALYDGAVGVKKRFDNGIRPSIAKELGDRQLSFILGSFLDEKLADIKDADVIFMNSTCFQDDLMEALEQKLEVLQPHAVVISLSKPLRSPAFHQYKSKLYEFSWGQATAFYHRKRLWKVYD